MLHGTESKSPTLTDTSPWVHRLACLVVCLIWPLIWVGGLVTTFDAGMAVPDWPETYGYNLFLYPYKTWLFGPFDLFIEHGHRLLGAIVGVVAIGLAVASYRCERRRWVTALAVILLVSIVIQGFLGGMRVVLGDRTLAMIHGCFAQAVFAGSVVMAAVTGPWWRRVGLKPIMAATPSRQVDGPSVTQEVSNGKGVDDSDRKRLDDSKENSDEPSPSQREDASIGHGRVGLSRGSLISWGLLVSLAYLQVVLGAQLRHVQPTMSPSGFAAVVGLHITTAFVLWAFVFVSWWRIRRCGELTLSRPAGFLIGLVALQIAIGIGTWVVNYGWPRFLQWMPGASEFLLRAKGFLDSLIVTSHVATGSLILAVGTLVLVRVWRLRFVLQE